VPSQQATTSYAASANYFAPPHSPVHPASSPPNASSRVPASFSEQSRFLVSPTGFPVTSTPLVYRRYGSTPTDSNIARVLSYEPVGRATQADMAGQMQFHQRSGPCYNSRQPEVKSSQAYDSSKLAFYSGSQAYDSGTQAYYSGSQAASASGSQAYDSGSQAYDTGKKVSYSGLQAYDSGKQPFYSGSQAYDIGKQACYSGSQACDNGKQACYSGSQAYDSGSQAYYSGSQAASASGSQAYASGSKTYSSGSQASDNGYRTPIMKNAQHMTNVPRSPAYQSKGKATQSKITGAMNVQPQLQQTYSSVQPQMGSLQTTSKGAYNTQILNNSPQRNNDTLSTYYQPVYDTTRVVQNDTLQYKNNLPSTHNSLQQPASASSRDYNSGYNPQMIFNVQAGTNMDHTKFDKYVSGATRTDLTWPMPIQPRLQPTYSSQIQMANSQGSNGNYSTQMMNNMLQRTNYDCTAYYQSVDKATCASRNRITQYQQNSHSTNDFKQTAAGSSSQAFNNGSNTPQMNNSTYGSQDDRVTSSQYIDGATGADMGRPGQYQPGPQPTFNSRHPAVVDSQVQNKGYSQQMIIPNMTNTRRNDGSSNQNGGAPSNQTTRDSSYQLYNSTYQGYNANY